MLSFAHRLLAVLIAFAVIGGPSTQSAPPTQQAMAAVMPCDMAMPDAGTPMAPCKGLTSDCVKQMGCVVNLALPARLPSTDMVFVASLVAYWSAGSLLVGVARQPEPLPPRTA